MKKLIFILLAVMFLGVSYSNAFFPFPSLKADFSRTETKIDKLQTDLSLVKEVQLKIDNNMSAMINISNKMEANLSNMINLTNQMSANLSANLTNTMKNEMAAAMAANMEVKGMIGSLDNSFKQSQSVGSGQLTNTSTAPSIVNTQTIIMGLVIVFLIVSNGFTMKMLVAKDVTTAALEGEKTDYKRSYYDAQKQLETLTMAIARDEDLTMDINKAFNPDAKVISGVRKKRKKR